MSSKRQAVRGRRHPRAVEELLRLETLLWDIGYRCVAGVDEVGLGPLAGPVVAAAVAFPARIRGLAVADSKTLSPRRRRELDAEVRTTAAAVSVAVVEVAEVDAFGVHAAAIEAMRRAVTTMTPPADYVLVDAREIPSLHVGQSAFVRGDGFIHCVAAASIVAKVYRDAMMVELDAQHPQYGFGRHMGYGTPAHLEALALHGPCAIHRRSFAPVRRAAERCT